MNNPYAPPQATVADDVEIDPAIVALRESHLAHEASVRSAGLLYYLGGALGIVSGITTFDGATAFDLGLGVAIIVASVIQLVVAYALRKFNRKARIGAGILSTIGLLLFPVGTLVNAYILYLLFSRKGRTVFSDEYARARELTPHLRYRTPVLLLAVIALLIGAVVFVLVLTAGGMPD